MPSHLDFASLPKLIGEKRKVVISLAGYEGAEVDEYFQLFVDYLEENRVEYILKDISF